MPEFQFNRDWMREQFIRVRDPRPPAGSAMQLNLPPNYLLIHRVWLGGLAVLSQLNAKAAFGGVLEEFLPGYAGLSPVTTRSAGRATCAGCGRYAARPTSRPARRGAVDLEHGSGRRTDHRAV